MMGYMGFGMQRWIYSRNPKKKLYERKNLKPFTPLQHYSRVFKLQPSITENKRSHGFLTILFVVIALIMVFLAFQNFTNYSNRYNRLVYNKTIIENNAAFNFLMNSGKNRLQGNRVYDAYSEFKLAQVIYPKNKELNQLLIETLSILCETNNNYCVELDDLLSSNF
ncbi:hypothetical protein [Aestuariivivens insulae]|uniref:hypothetical protein n=1 Tax=Aestuariivivens insulae TaxID=1621988 RepID=UPI001F5A1AFA|nr:hypothetical protein [Aestuariivivens insulae]